MVALLSLVYVCNGTFNGVVFFSKDQSLVVVCEVSYETSADGGARYKI